ncbi:hypothetical protein ACOME3_001449 [Neoechinorhynchus agilis]
MSTQISLIQLFRYFDHNEDGRIDYQLALNALQAHSLVLLESDQKMVKEACCGNDDGQISENEFMEVARLIADRRPEAEDEVREMLSIFDKDNTGMVNAYDVKHAVVTLGDGVNKADVERVFAEASGEDDEGMVSIEKLDLLKIARERVRLSTRRFHSAIKEDHKTRKRMWKLEKLISKETLFLNSIDEQFEDKIMPRRIVLDELNCEMLLLMRTHKGCVPFIEHCRQRMTEQLQLGFDKMIDSAEVNISKSIDLIELFGTLKSQQYDKYIMVRFCYSRSLAAINVFKKGACACQRIHEMEFDRFTNTVNSLAPTQNVQTDLILYNIPAEDGNLLMCPDRRRYSLMLWINELKNQLNGTGCNEQSTLSLDIIPRSTKDICLNTEKVHLKKKKLDPFSFPKLEPLSRRNLHE